MVSQTSPQSNTCRARQTQAGHQEQGNKTERSLLTCNFLPHTHPVTSGSSGAVTLVGVVVVVVVVVMVVIVVVGNSCSSSCSSSRGPGGIGWRYVVVVVVVMVVVVVGVMGVVPASCGGVVGGKVVGRCSSVVLLLLVGV